MNKEVNNGYLSGNKIEKRNAHNMSSLLPILGA
jgi:hypothetical protein